MYVQVNFVTFFVGSEVAGAASIIIFYNVSRRVVTESGWAVINNDTIL